MIGFDLRPLDWDYYLGWVEEAPPLQSLLLSPVSPSSEPHSAFCPPPLALHWHTTNRTYTAWTCAQMYILTAYHMQYDHIFTLNIFYLDQMASFMEGQSQIETQKSWQVKYQTLVHESQSNQVSMYLDGRHLHDLIDILQRAGDVPQPCLVGQLFGTCIYREKVEFLKMSARNFTAFFHQIIWHKSSGRVVCDYKPMSNTFWHII